MMKHRYTIHENHGLAVVAFGPSVNGDEIISLLQSVLDDGRWRSGFARLWDGRAVKYLDVEPHHLRDHAEYLKTVPDRAGSGRSAIVARREIDAMAAQLYHIRVRQILGAETRVFADLTEAADFLGVPADICHL